ncbi:MAG: hypothetical protein AAF851_05655 [Myxococcota bacterium]
MSVRDIETLSIGALDSDAVASGRAGGAKLLRTLAGVSNSQRIEPSMMLSVSFPGDFDDSAFGLDDPAPENGYRNALLFTPTERFRELTRWVVPRRPGWKTAGVRCFAFGTPNSRFTLGLGDGQTEPQEVASATFDGLGNGVAMSGTWELSPQPIPELQRAILYVRGERTDVDLAPTSEVGTNTWTVGTEPPRFLFTSNTQLYFFGQPFTLSAFAFGLYAVAAFAPGGRRIFTRAIRAFGSQSPDVDFDGTQTLTVGHLSDRQVEEASKEGAVFEIIRLPQVAILSLAIIGGVS